MSRGNRLMLRLSIFDTHIRGNVLGNSPITNQRYDIIQQNIDYVFHHCQFILTQIRQKPSNSFRVIFLGPKYVRDISHNICELPKLLVQGVHVHQSNSRTTSRPIYSEEVSLESYLLDGSYKSNNMLNS